LYSRSAAVLAIGTELTDGQVVNSNSAWLSARLTELGFQVNEHRTVADDREQIRRSLKELASRAQLLFVTGGLGPTSDDFTRELIAEFVGQPLEFHEASWRHVVQRLESRGVQVHERQKQQCWFPRGAEVLTNSAGTANAFLYQQKDLEIFVLPGPPREIETIWREHLSQRFEQRLPAASKRTCHIWRCLGRGESEFAEMVQPLFDQSELEVGYRANLPYVEIKVWTRGAPSEAELKIFAELNRTLGPWLVTRDQEDVLVLLLEKLSQNKLGLLVEDHATLGLWAERLVKIKQMSSSPIMVQTDFSAYQASVRSSGPNSEVNSVMRLRLTAHFDRDREPAWWGWNLEILWPAGQNSVEILSPFRLSADNERSRKYLVERSIQLALNVLSVQS